MARSNSTPGARSAPPAEQANPTPQVGAKPAETPKPADPTDNPLDLAPPPALRPSKPRPGAEFVDVETTGPFMLTDPTNLQAISHKGVTKDVELTTFIETALADGRLKKV